MLVAVNYHYVRPEYNTPYGGIHGLTVAQFAQQLELLARAGEFVSADDCREAVRGTRVLPPRAVLITFDDGLREQFDEALPVLDRLGVPGLFFINTRPIANATVLAVHKVHYLRATVAPNVLNDAWQQQFVEQGIDAEELCANTNIAARYRYDDSTSARIKYILNHALPLDAREQVVARVFDRLADQRESALSRKLYMAPAQLRELGTRRYIGSHTADHWPLHLVEPSRLKTLFQEANQHLAAWTGYSPYAASYPYGNRDVASDRVVDAAAQCGIEYAFTMERAANRDFHQPLRLARFDCNDVPGGKSCNLPVDRWFAELGGSTWYLAG